MKTDGRYKDLPLEKLNSQISICNLKCVHFPYVVFHSDFEAVLKLEPGNKQAINELTKIRNVCTPMIFYVNLQ